jgi:VCBS repeat protein
MSFRSSVAGFAALLVLLIATSSAFATTFVVPPDRDLIHRANAIVIATAMASYSRPGTDLLSAAAIETVTPMQIEETIKGRFGLTLEVVEPGGTYGGVSMLLAGVPQFEAGQRMLLFLASTGKDRWAVTELVLGKFTFTTDESGERLLVRDEDEIVGWDPNLKPHVESRRSADRFLQFVRTEAAGKAAAIDYSVPTMPLTTTRSRIRPATMATGFSATSYTMTVSGSMGARWTVFPSQLTWFTGTTTEPGAPNGGITAAQVAMAAWDNDCPSNVNYAYGGVDNGSHTQGLHAPDGANTILFERDLSAWGVSPFSCSGSSYSGTLGIGGVTSASGTNTLGSETFATTQEGDVEMNRGIANCTLLFNNGDFNSAVTHELGHTLGFRHSDQNRPGNAACSTDPSLECSNSAIMTAFVTAGLNATLAAWDQHAVGAVYPGGSCSTCTAPSITSQPQSKTITSGSSTTLSVTATGTAPLSYQWYVGASGNTGSPVSGGTGSSVTVSPTTTTSYWVRVSNSCGSANSSTATVTVTASTGATTKLVWRKYTTGENTIWTMNGTNVTSTTALPTISDLNLKIEAVADFNGDGVLDLFWRNQQTTANTIWIMNGNSLASEVNVPAIDAAWHVQGAADFNGDGRADLVWRNYRTGQNTLWTMNGGTVTSTVSMDSLADTRWKIQAVADFNKDGHPDLAWRNQVTGEDMIWLMTGTTSHSATVVIATVADSSWRIQGAMDMNGDGYPDLVWRHYTTGGNSVWFMSGTSVASGGSIPALTDTNWHLQETADPGTSFPNQPDFNGDGHGDLVWRNYANGQDSVWFMNGATVVAGGTVETLTDVNWKIDAVGDLNGDGSPDLIWRNQSTGANMAWIMSGTTHVSTLTLPSLDPGWHMKGAADFDGNGRCDLVWRNSTGANMVWLMDGATLLNSVILDTVNGTSWNIGAIADLNHDRQPDLVWRNDATGESSVWFMNFTTVASAGQVPLQLDLNWRLQGAADLNADGNPDLIWRNYSSGLNTVWFMNGTSVSSAASPTTVSDTNWHLQGAGD